MAEELLRRFGSFAEVIGAMPERLGEVPGASAALNDAFVARNGYVSFKELGLI